MTKYQRGELMDGWNDCPMPMLLSRGTASAGLATAKSRKRAVRLPVVGQASAGPESTGSNDLNPAPPPAGGPLSAPPTQMPPPPAQKAAPAGVEASPGARDPAEDVDTAEAESKLRAVIAAADVSAAERDFFVKRLVEPFGELEAQHQRFMAQIVDGVAAKAPGLKAQVVNYMMVHSGVSTWCVPLKKLIETA